MRDPVYVLGISAFYHDAAACITRDGEILAAAQEERFTRKKHDPRFPVNAIQYCLESSNVEPDDLAAVAFYDNPLLSMDRIMRTLACAGRAGLEMWLNGAPGWLSTKLFIERLVKEELHTDVPVLYSEHHFSHAASAFFPSPFKEAAILTIDGVGEWATTTLAVGNESDVQVLKEIHFPHSLGMLYSVFTQFCGFKVNSGEYKLMGLAPYGHPIHVDTIYERLIDVADDGSFRLDMEYFGFANSMSMTNEAFHALFDGPPREPEARITQREMDLAASIQRVTEQIVLGLCRHLRELTHQSNLCMAGGVSLNCVANGKLLEERIFDRLWIQPAAGDAGGSIGAAQMVTHVYFAVPRPPIDGQRDRQRGSFLGPSFTNSEVQAFLDYHEYSYCKVSDTERAQCVAQALSDGNIVGYMVGNMEFGPRALGARSILGDARNAKSQSVMNRKIKFRESFRPFAPSVLEERCSEFFDLDAESPYMLLVAAVRHDLQIPVENIGGEDLIETVNQVRSSVPAVTHVDYSARIQTVSAHAKPDFYQLIQEFEKLTGIGVIVNTSFNVRGEPIVCTPQDAYKCFMRTDMDVLVIENFVLYKEQQPEYVDVDNWRAEYALD